MSRFRISVFPPYRILCPVCRRRTIKLVEGARCRGCGSRIGNVVESEGSFRIAITKKTSARIRKAAKGGGRIMT